jgi:hypothetical protein
LYDDEKHLRLYCIRYGSIAIILGGGGEKPEGVRALQDDPKLKEENYRLRAIAKRINDRIKDKDLYWDGNELGGDLNFYDDEQE